ncbi:short-chain dehydrogenase/reductase SDR [Deferribacter desulfuricans SSM1]|uniref:Short-chain dehydrogenase/reductase SDR n=1 Tax=Deferribacter desulfuricans (strain DSM 14783 / JCM 11476 / NBRC 101012 / SSM1) TaxID=639282 RepID=D3P8M8_DEFDS|nr:SDR family NAD(P)-dependent oxidoreductase [Deferribacter desulfuricans]BAI81068.1 short-chain dehydrogenase/reductase SDR [Deferribacter desulfuricans SSM1]
MQQKEPLKNKNILITGATDGIGKNLALRLAKKGHNLIIHGRNEEKLSRLKNDLEKYDIKVSIVLADFSNLKDTYNAFTKLTNLSISILVNNAATFSKQLTFTKDGYELTYQVNYLSHFLITHILLENLTSSEEAKIINVSSMAHSNYINLDEIRNHIFPTGFEAYAVSKLCNIIFTFKLHRYFTEKKINNITVNSLHPGVLNTKLLVNNWGAIGSDPENGAKMIEFVMNQPIEISGKYFSDYKEEKPSQIAFDTKIQDELYEISINQLMKAGIQINKLQ